MFMYALALSFSLFSLCHAMTDESSIPESQSIWICEKPAFIENCSKGSQYLTRQQLTIITKAWDRFIEIASKNNEELSRADMCINMHKVFHDKANCFHEASIQLLESPLLNDNFIRLIQRADDLDFRDYKIRKLQEIILTLATPDDYKQSYADYNILLMKLIKQGHQATLRSYLENNNPVNIIVNEYGETGLMRAIKTNNLAIAQILISCPNLAINAQDFTALNTALHWTIERNKKEIFELILTHPLLDINIKNAKGRTPLMLAAFKGNQYFVEQILNQFPNVDLTITDHTGKNVFDLTKPEIREIIRNHQTN